MFPDKSIFEQITRNAIAGVFKPTHRAKSISKSEKIRVIYFMCGKKLASEFDSYGITLLSDTQKNALLKAFKQLFAYNNIQFEGKKISDYWKELAKQDDYLIPVTK